MNIFAHSTYKEFLRAYLVANDKRGVISQLAAVCGCDRTYISQVLNGKAELTPDHLILLCEHLRLTESENEYLLLMLLRDRSGSLRARKNLDIKIKRLKREALTASNKIYSREKPKEIRDELRTLYYSSWLYGAVHILTSIPDFQTAAAIGEKLQISASSAAQILKDLVEMHAVNAEKGRFKHSGEDVYLPVHFAQNATNHLSWRMKAVERFNQKEDIHYTVAFSVSQKDVEKLRAQVLHLIEEQRKLVRSSGTEVALAFCADFFEL